MNMPKITFEVARSYRPRSYIVNIFDYHHYGFTGTSLNLIKHYLSNRTQCVGTNPSISSI